MARDQELLDLLDTLYESRNPTRRWLHRSRRDWLIDTLKSLGPVERALEVGPGLGVYLPTLTAIARGVTAADVDEGCLRRAREMKEGPTNLHFVRDDITSSQLPARSFDLILCSEVIEHIRDSAAALRGMHELLKENGVLVLSTPQRFSPLEVCAKVAFLPGIIRLVRFIYGEAVFETGHINLMTQRQVKQQLAAAGFDVVAEHWSGFYLPLVAEFGGEPGLGVLRYLEAALRKGPFNWLLWTQYYVARKGSGLSSREPEPHPRTSSTSSPTRTVPPSTT